MKKVMTFVAVLGICALGAINVQAMRPVIDTDGHVAFDTEDCVYRCLGSPFDCVRT